MRETKAINTEGIKAALRSQSKSSLDKIQTQSASSLEDGLPSPSSANQEKRKTRKSIKVESLASPQSAIAKDSYFDQLIEFIPGKVFFGVNTMKHPAAPVGVHEFNVDKEFAYIPFFADFGPVSIAHVFRFYQLMERKLEQYEQMVMLCTNTSEKCSNAAFLVCSYAFMKGYDTPESAYARLKSTPNIKLPLLPFRDAGYGPATYWIDILDCLRALKKGSQVWKFATLDNFNLEEYEFYEKVENGDWTWVLPKFFLALATPHEEPPAHLVRFHEDVKHGRIVPLRPSPANSKYDPMIDLDKIVNYHKSSNVKGMVRLNNALYDRQRVISLGLNHYELFFPDGSVPNDDIIRQFMQICDDTLPYHLLAETGLYNGSTYGSVKGDHTRGALSVHCKAGLGRTGSLICCWMMRTLGWTARECISWCRLMRPGSVVGPQQNWLETVEKRMHEWGIKDRQRSIQKSAFLDTTRNDGTEDLQESTHGGMQVPVQPRKIDRDLPQHDERNKSLTSLVMQDVKALFLGGFQGTKRRVSSTSLDPK